MAKSNALRKQVNLGGRPKKFVGASRPVTVTLPERTLVLLAKLDSDRANAVVKAVDAVTGSVECAAPLVEVVEVENGQGIIIVGPSTFLKQIPFLRLIQVSLGRYLLVIPTGTSIDSLELALLELLQDVDIENDKYEHTLLSELSCCLAHQRRKKSVSKAELLLIDL